MPKQHNSSSTLVQRAQITNLVRTYGITRDQARRLLSKIGNDKAKLSEAARILKARLPSRSIARAKDPAEEGRVCSYIEAL
jgi:hypothetical protein